MNVFIPPKYEPVQKETSTARLHRTGISHNSHERKRENEKKIQFIRNGNVQRHSEWHWKIIYLFFSQLRSFFAFPMNMRDSKHTLPHFFCHFEIFPLALNLWVFFLVSTSTHLDQFEARIAIFITGVKKTHQPLAWNMNKFFFHPKKQDPGTRFGHSHVNIYFPTEIRFLQADTLFLIFYFEYVLCVVLNVEINLCEKISWMKAFHCKLTKCNCTWHWFNYEA